MQYSDVDIEAATPRDCITTSHVVHSPIPKKRGRFFHQELAARENQSLYLNEAPTSLFGSGGSQFELQIGTGSTEEETSKSNFEKTFSRPDKLSKSSRDEYLRSRQLLRPNEVLLAPPNVNPFISSRSRNNSRKVKQIVKLTTPSRYRLDFEHDSVIGKGNFATVYRARGRLDGIFYAVKEIHLSVSRNSVGQVLIPEVCALAVLQSCPNVIRYFSSWIDDDDKIFIQTELCDMGTLDFFILQTERQQTFHPVLTTLPPSVRGRSDSYQALHTFDSIAVREENHFHPRHSSSMAAKTSCQDPIDVAEALHTTKRHENGAEPECSDVSERDLERLAWVVIHQIGGALQFMHRHGT